MVSYSDRCEVDLPDGHRFPMMKYRLIREQLLYEGILRPTQLFEPEFIDEEILLLTHTPEYWHRIKTGTLTETEVRKLGFPQSPSLVRRSHSAVSGTFWTALNALRDGIAFNIAGGTHHAFAERGEGFCLLNDIAVSINYFLQNKMITGNVLIVDLDVHQGNGNAVLFAGHPSVFTFSIHCKDNYPLKKEVSCLDISLPAHTDDETYLQNLDEHWVPLLDTLRPQIIYYIAGADVLATDKLGKFNLSLQGCIQRDERVIREAYERKIPLAIVKGGGYSEKYTDIIAAHTATYKVAKDFFD